jgi:hypothetical protein
VGGLDDQLVKLEIGLGDLVPLTFSMAEDILVNVCSSEPAGRRECPGQKSQHGRSLDRGPGEVQVLEIRLDQLPHPDAAVRCADQQTFVDQSLHGLPDRSTTGGETGGQLDLVHLVPGGKVPSSPGRQFGW